MKLLKTLSRLLASIIIVVAVLELCARLDDFLSYGAPILSSYSSDNLVGRDQFGKRGNPGARYKKWEMNSLGYRGPELRSGTVRIVCFGASETFGLYEAAGQEYPRQLEKDLNRWAGKPMFEVVNVAYPAQSVADAVARVPEIVGNVRPRFAVIYPSPASYIRPHQVAALDKEAEAPPAGFEWRLGERMRTAAKSFLPEFIQNELRELQIRAKEEDIKKRTAGQQLMDRVPEENVILFRSDLVRLVQALRQHSVEPVLVTHATLFGKELSGSDRQMLSAWRWWVPLLKEEGFIDMEKRMNSAVRDVAREQHVVLVDAAAEIAPGSEHFADFAHFTTLGAEVMAAKVSRGMEPILYAEVAGPDKRD